MDALRQFLQEEGFRFTDRQWRVLQLRFGLEDGQPRSLEETAQILGIPRERVRQIESCALRRARPCRRSRPIREFYQ